MASTVPLRGNVALARITSSRITYRSTLRETEVRNSRCLKEY